MTDKTQRRIVACLAAFEGWPTEVVEQGVFKEMHGLVAVCALADHMGERRGTELCIPLEWWQRNFRHPMDRLNALVADLVKASPPLSAEER